MPLNTRPWRGRPCFIVGGGLSLQGFDFSRLDGHLVIAINRAIEFTKPAIHITVDPLYYDTLFNRILPDGEEYTLWAREQFLSYDRGHKLFGCTGGDPRLPPGVRMVLTNRKDWTHRWDDGPFQLAGSGITALSAGYLAGSMNIHLLGFDMKEGRFHSGYGRQTNVSCYDSFRKGITLRAAPHLKAAGAVVRNVNPNDSLPCFERVDFDDIPAPLKMPLVVSFHTPDPWYTSHANRLRSSLRDFGLECEIHVLEDPGTWKSAACLKPGFILDMLEKHEGRPILFLDADATLEQFPVVFDGMDADMAAHYRGGRELLSSTLYFSNTDSSREIVRGWAQRCVEQPDRRFGDQENLQDVADEEKFRIHRLTADYACIYDSMRSDSRDPVILQWQASRRGRQRYRLNDRYTPPQHASGRPLPLRAPVPPPPH